LLIYFNIFQSKVNLLFIVIKWDVYDLMVLGNFFGFIIVMQQKIN